MKAVHRASTVPGSLSAVRSNPSSSSLFLWNYAYYTPGNPGCQQRSFCRCRC